MNRILYSVVSCGSLFSDSAYKTERIIYLYMWKDILWFEWLYQVSDCNEWVMSLNYNHTKKEKILKSGKHKRWYWVVWLRKDTIRKSFLVSRLVAIAFIPNPDDLPCVLHKKEDLDENWLLYNWSDNLYWGTHRDNMIDMINKWRANNHLVFNNPKIWLWKLWKLNPNSKKVNQYTIDWMLIRNWDSIADVQRDLKINHAHISAVCLWKRRTAGGFVWKYKPN